MSCWITKASMSSLKENLTLREIFTHLRPSIAVQHLFIDNKKQKENRNKKHHSFIMMSDTFHGMNNAKEYEVK